MTRIGIISDTHGCWDEKFQSYFASCDEIWHAGDIGDMTVADHFESMKPRFRAVFGNIDGEEMRQRYPEVAMFQTEGIKVMMKHIGGYPGKYDPSVRRWLKEYHPQLFVSGHSHILKVMPDYQSYLLHVNPGAAGKVGWHKERTLVRLTIDGEKVEDCEIISLGSKTRI